MDFIGNIANELHESGQRISHNELGQMLNQVEGTHFHENKRRIHRECSDAYRKFQEAGDQQTADNIYNHITGNN